MASFKKGLMEFGEGFLLSFGDTVATNIAEKAKQDRADILSTTKDLKTRIKAGKTADSKLKMKYMERGNDILATLPGLDSNTLRNALASPEYGKALLAQAKADTLGNAEWYKPIAKQLGLENANPYTNKKDRKPLSTLIKEFRTGPISKKDDKAKDEDTMAEDTIRTIFGGGMSPEAIIRAGGKRLGARFSPEEIERYGGAGYTPRTVRSKGGAVNLRSPTKASQTAVSALTYAQGKIASAYTQKKPGIPGPIIDPPVFDLIMNGKSSPVAKLMEDFREIIVTPQGSTASPNDLINYLSRTRQEGLMTSPIRAKGLKGTYEGLDAVHMVSVGKGADGRDIMKPLTPLMLLRRYMELYNDDFRNRTTAQKQLPEDLLPVSN